MCLIGIFINLGYLYNKKYNSNKNTQEILKKTNITHSLELIGFILDIVNFFLISNAKLATELLNNYYLQHKILIKIIYFFAGLVIIGIFSSIIFIKLKSKNRNSQFNEVELK